MLKKNDLLKIQINYFAHNEGSSSRNTSYRYNVNNQAFEIIENTEAIYPVEYDGQPYPMGLPPTPDMTLH